MGDLITIGMAELKVVKAPKSITTVGLGSCVGICLFDNKEKILGVSHAMLPKSASIINNTNKAKFVDTSIDELLSQMIRLGAVKTRIVAKIIGGAQMFDYDSVLDSMRIGDRNIQSSRACLSMLGIPIIAEDVGGNYGRTIIASSKNGMVTIKVVAGPITEI